MIYRDTLMMERETMEIGLVSRYTLEDYSKLTVDIITKDREIERMYNKNDRDYNILIRNMKRGVTTVYLSDNIIEPSILKTLFSPIDILDFYSIVKPTVTRTIYLPSSPFYHKKIERTVKITPILISGFDSSIKKHFIFYLTDNISFKNNIKRKDISTILLFEKRDNIIQGYGIAFYSLSLHHNNKRYRDKSIER